MNKNILSNIWRFSATKSVVFMLIIPTVGSLVALGAFYLYLHQTKNDVMFTNVAGRQRMLSEQMSAYTHMVFDLGQEEDREPLRELVATFDQSIAALDKGGDVMGIRLSPPPPDIRNSINLVKRLWQDVKPALLLIADQPTSSPEAVKAKNFIQANIHRLRDLSNDVVFSFELISHQKKEQIFKILVIVLSINFILLFTGVLITKRYLNERKKAADTLLESKAYTESIIRNFLDTLVVVDTKARIKTVNPETCSLLGYREEELLGEHIRKVFAEEEEEEVRALFQFFREPKQNELDPHMEIRNVELTYLTKGGIRIPMSFNACTLTDRGGSVTGVVAGAKDMSSMKQAQEALLESKVYTDNILASMTDALFVVAADATIQTVNTAACALLDYTEDEFTGMSIGKVFAEEEEEEEEFTKHVLSMAKSKLQVLHDRDPEDFNHLLQTAHMGVVIVGSDGKIVMVNKETTSIFDYDEGDLIGEMIHILLPADLREIHEKERGEFMANPSPRFMGKERILKAQHKDGTMLEMEVGLIPLQINGETQVVGVVRETSSKERWEFIKLTRFGRLFAEEEEEEEEVFWNVDRTLVAKNGKRIPVLMSGAILHDDSGEVQGAVLVAKDITERKRAEKELEQLHRENELILDSAGDGLYGLDENGNTMFVNPAALKMTGHAREDLIGKNHHDIVHNAKADDTPYPSEECPVHITLKDGLVHHADIEVFWRKDGTSFPVEYTSTPKRDENGGLVGAVVTFRDITERKQAEEKLKKYVKELEKWHNVTVDRELKMIELKKEIKDLEERMAGFSNPTE